MSGNEPTPENPATPDDEHIQTPEQMPAAEVLAAHLLRPEQGEMPFAVVMGKAVTELPKDLYIPPQALEVFLEAFEGPLDLLLYLIKRQNLDILEIDVSMITEQYMRYVELMDAMQFELAAEYLLMAAMLAEIKSRMLLPRSSELDEDEEDPRAQLIRRLQEYERFKKVAEDIQREALSTRERMSQVLERLSGQQFVPFVALFSAQEGRLGVVVTFLAIMELIKESLVEIVQTENFGPIHVKARAE